jgi:hypothetical protein
MSITSNYSGIAAADYVSTALLGAPTLDAQKVQIMPNIKHKLNIRKVGLDATIKPYAANFAGVTGLTYSEQVLDPWDFTVHIEEDRKLLEATFEAERMQPGSQNSDVTLQDWMVDRLSRSINNKVEKAIWGAVSGAQDSIMNAFDGYEEILTASADAVKITGSTLTKSNILTEMEKVYEALYGLEVEQERFTFYVSPKTASVYRMKIGTDSPISQYSERMPLSYQGHEIFVSHGISDGAIIAADSANLFFGTDLTSDMNSVLVVDMMQQTADNVVRFRLDAKADVAVAYTAETVIRYIPA